MSEEEWEVGEGWEEVEEEVWRPGAIALRIGCTVLAMQVRRPWINLGYT